MKGVILQCLREMVKSKFGEAKWNEIVKEAGTDAPALILASSDIEDSTALGCVHAACNVLGVTLPQAADAFGDFWMNEFAPKIYPSLLQGSVSAKDFLLLMDETHQRVTRTIPNARPPRFTFDWEDATTLLMTYQSERCLIDVAVGLAKGVGRYYKESLTVERVSDSQLRVRFLGPAAPR